MADHTINVSRLTRKLRAIWGLRGSDYPTAAEDVPGYIALEMDRPEWLLPGGEYPFATTFFGAAVAGQVLIASIFNPVGTGVMLVLEEYVISEQSGPTSLILGWINVDTALGSGGLFTRDGRSGDPVLGQNFGMSVRSGTIALPGPGASFYAVPNGVVGSREVVIPPGRGVTINQSTVNLAGRISFAGRVRPLEAGLLS